ncbi:MAG TPA: hypothetical protein DCO79_08130 [Spirochaeta sp.]|nr:hypothetical protein [Spirochaeta sp.]
MTQITNGWVLSMKKKKRYIGLAEYKIQLVNSLSGGNQQKVVFGKWVMNQPRIFLLAEPARGVDVRAKFEIYSIISNLAKSGSTV